DNDAIRRQQARCSQAQSHFVHVHEGADMAGEHIQIEKCDGVRDHAGSSVGKRLKTVLWAAPKEQFVSEYLQTGIEDGLTRDEFLVHKCAPSYSQRFFGLTAQGRPASCLRKGGRLKRTCSSDWSGHRAKKFRVRFRLG